MRIILEMQTNSKSSSLAPAKAYPNDNEGEAAYHSTLAAAAVSKVEEHTVAMLDRELNVLESKTYYH